MRKFLALLSLIFIIISLPLSAKEIRQFRDWQVKCDDYQNCAATISITSDETIGIDYTLSLERKYYSEFWDFSFIAYEAQPKLDENIAIIIDGEEIIITQPEQFAAYNLLNQYYFLGESGQIIFDKIINGSQMQIIFIDEDGIERAPIFSLSGVAASLLYIDEKQERLGIARKIGIEPENGNPVTQREPHPIDEQLLSLQIEANACDPLEDLPHGKDIMTYRLDAQSSLALIPCWAGAYNFGYTAYRLDRYGAEQLLFAAYSDEGGWSGTKYLVNPYFDERYNRLHDFFKGRGLGDCGSIGLWQWNGYDFSLLQYEYREECAGLSEGEELGRFPIIFRHEDYIAPKEME